MDPITEHNLALQRNGCFSAADLDANRKGRYSLAQINQFQGGKSYLRQNIGLHEDRTSLTASVVAVGLVLFTVVLDFNGNLKVLEEALGNVFLPLMLSALILALFFILAVIPHQYRDTVAAYKSRGPSSSVMPLEAIQTIEARAEVFTPQPRRGRRDEKPSRGPHILQMDGIPFLVPESLRQVIQPKRLYRVYAVHTPSGWILLSMETLERSAAEAAPRGYALKPVRDQVVREKSAEGAPNHAGY